MKYLIRVIILFLICAALSACGKSYSGKEQPKVINGVMDLSGWNFETDGPVKLDGDWFFFWNSFIIPAGGPIGEESSLTGYMAVPSSWAGKYFKAGILPVIGIASYRVKIIFPDNITGSFSLRFPSIDTACNLFINDKMLYSNGTVGESVELSRPFYYAPKMIVSDIRKETVITLHMSNFHYPRPGIRDSILLGETSSISSGFEKYLVIDIFLIGAIFLMGMYHLGVYFLRSSDRSALYFALFCISTVIRLAVTGEGYAYRLEWFSWNIGTAMEYIFFYTSVATCGLFMHSLYPVEISRLTAGVIISVSSVFTLIVFIFPVMFYARTLIYFNIFLAVSICYFTYALIIAKIRKRESAGIFLFGSAVLFASVLNDILYNYRITPISYTVPYGLYSFFFVQSFLLSSRFSKAFAAAEELSHRLEDKVAERTFELEGEKEKLRAHSMIIDKEIELARIIQKELIPQFCPGEYIHSLYKPMHKVGGDFFDFLRFRDSEKIGIFVSDVSGHGVPAAFITSMIKAIIIQASDKKDNPADLLHYINDVLFNRTGGNYCTAFYGIYNPDDRSLVYSIAGHNKPYVVTGDSVRLLDGFTGIPIGIMGNEDIVSGKRDYKNTFEIIPAGSKLILYTDGLTEARRADESGTFEDMIENILIELGPLPCAEFIDNLYARLKSYRGSDTFDDDVCLICLEVK